MAALGVFTLRLFKFIKSPRFSPEILTDTYSLKFQTVENILRVKNFRVFSKNAEFEGAKNPFGKPDIVRKKTVPIPKILLISPEGKVMQQLTLEEAQNLAKRRNLNLVQIVDLALKTSVPTYQLMSKTQLVHEEVEAKNKKALEKKMTVKIAKLVIISSNIDKHDLETKINKMIKLLNKNHKVQVFVSTDGNKNAAEAVIKTIESSIAEKGNLKGKVQKNSGMKLYLEPILPTKIKDSSQ